MNAQTLYMYGIHYAFLERNKTSLHYHYYYNIGTKFSEQAFADICGRSVRSLHYLRNGDYKFRWTARKQYLFS